MQSRRHSIIESLTNVFAGLIISFTVTQLFHIYERDIQLYIWSGFEWKLSVGSNAIVTIILTFISILRGYWIRRWFNSRLTKQ